jgi:hypothetical protein
MANYRKKCTFCITLGSLIFTNSDCNVRWIAIFLKRAAEYVTDITLALSHALTHNFKTSG